jgi:signal transduction histidine kinase
MRIALITIAAIALAMFAFCEIGMAYPVAWWLYLFVAIAFTAGLIRPVPVRSQLARLGALMAVIIVLAALYLVEWTTRKPFLHDLGRVHVGMTETEVRHIMGRYMEGTGWPAMPGSSPSNAPGRLNVAGSTSQYSTETSSSGEMVIRDSLVFQHSKDGAFNSDWGIISLSSGRVVSVQFSPD